MTFASWPSTVQPAEPFNGTQWRSWCWAPGGRSEAFCGHGCYRVVPAPYGSTERIKAGKLAISGLSGKGGHRCCRHRR